MTKPIVLTGLLFLAMLLPYLPGRFDASAAALSFVAQVAGSTSLLLVPIGLAWIIDPRRTLLWRRLVIIGLALLVVVTILAAAAVNQLALGAILGVAAILFLRRTHEWLHAERNQLGGVRNSAPRYLVLVPLLLVAFRIAVIPRAAEWSAGRAIRNSARLIAEIESFRDRRGHYPVSLQSLNRDVPTGVIGLERFHYEPNGEGYNLFLIRPSIQLDAMEVMLFNPRNEHRFTSHELDILQYDGEELDRRRGDWRRTPLAHPQWISILFD